MKNVEICPRCGFSCGDHEFSTKVENWPQGLPPPPDLPATAHPHPVGVCCSPFEVGDKLFLSTADLDMPPLRVKFKSLMEIEAAHFTLVNNKWEQDGNAKAFVAAVQVIPESIYPCHRTLYDATFLENKVDVPVDALTALEKWPVLEVG